MNQQAKESIRYLPGGNILFGRYPQGTDGEIKPIEWKVLKKQYGRLFVISEYGLVPKAYHDTKTDGIAWEDCSVRRWLNDEFLHTAFDQTEQGMISIVTTSAGGNPKYPVNPGNRTNDRVFLPSIGEVDQFIKDEKSRVCRPTDFARAQGAWSSPDTGNSWWWLRTPGSTSDHTADVDFGGSTHFAGSSSVIKDSVVRPALWINLPDADDIIGYDLPYLSNGNILYGHYPQGENGQVEPIEWRILENTGKSILVISEYALDVQPFHNIYFVNNMVRSDLSAWVDSTFIEQAFTASEQERIPKITLYKDDGYSEEAYKSKVFLFSINEAKKYFTDDSARKCRPSAYTAAQEIILNRDGYCSWWLRSYLGSSHAASVGQDGSIIYQTHVPARLPVRPAMRIKLNL